MSCLEEVRLRCLEQLDCPLKKTAHSLVFGKGSSSAPVFIIGEAPGRDEDLQGLPFVGRAGVELDKMLGLCGLTLADVYVANILKYRPPDNRNPQVSEIIAHTPFLVEQIKCVRPRVIVALGNFASKFVLSGFSVGGMKDQEGISRTHGNFFVVDAFGLTFTVMPCYHPAAMLYNPALRAVMQEDFVKLRTVLEK